MANTTTIEKIVKIKEILIEKNGVAEYERLSMQELKLKKDRELQESYCNGIFAARELLMSLDFGTVVDANKE